LSVAVSAIVAGVIAGVGAYYAGTLAAPAEVIREVTKTVERTTTITAPPTTVTVTKTETVTATPPPTLPPTSIKIGVIASLSGWAAAYGVSAKEGLELAIGEVNEAGGVNGRSLQLIVYDDASDAKQSIALSHKLIQEDKVKAALALTHTGAVLSITRIWQDAKIPLLTVYSSHPDVTATGDYNFRIIFHVSQSGSVGAGFVVQDLGARKIALLIADVDYTRQDSLYFKDKVAKLGGTIVYEKIYPLDTREFRAFLTAVKETGAEALYIDSYVSDGAAIVIQARELGLNLPIVGPISIHSPVFLRTAGQAAEGVYVTTLFDPSVGTEVVKKFISKYSEKYGRTPDVFAALGYDAGKILAESIRIGGAEPSEIREGLMKVSNLQGVTGFIKGYTPDRELLRPLNVLIVKGGEFVLHKVVDDPALITPYRLG